MWRIRLHQLCLMFPDTTLLNQILWTSYFNLKHTMDNQRCHSSAQTQYTSRWVLKVEFLVMGIRGRSQDCMRTTVSSVGDGMDCKSVPLSTFRVLLWPGITPCARITCCAWFTSTGYSVRNTSWSQDGLKVELAPQVVSGDTANILSFLFHL